MGLGFLRWGRRISLPQDLPVARFPAGYGPAERRRDFRATFSTPAGRRVLWTLFDWGGIYRPVAVKGDPYETYHRDGRRDIVLRVLKMLEDEARPRPEAALGSAEEQEGEGA